MEVLCEKLMVTQESRNSPCLMEFKGLLLCSQQPCSGPYPESGASSPHFPTLYL